MIWEEMHQSLQKHVFKHNISPTYHDLLTYSLQKGCSVDMLPDPIHHLQDPHCTIYQAQQDLGWTQLCYGRLSPAWVTVQNDQHPAINGMHYHYVKVQTIIWQAVFKAWHQNQHLHPPHHDQQDKTQLCAIICQIIHDAKQDPLLHDTVDQAEPESHLSTTNLASSAMDNKQHQPHTQATSARLPNSELAKLHYIHT